MDKLTRRSFLASVAATAVAVTMPAALSHIPKGRWVRCVQTLPGGYVGSVHIYTTALSDDDLFDMLRHPPPGGVPTIEVSADNPLVGYTENNGVFRCHIKPNNKTGWTILQAQVEKAEYPTSYIQTQGEPVTRPQTTALVKGPFEGSLEGKEIEGDGYHDYDQDGKWLGILVEESRENLCIHSLTLEKE